MTIHHSAIRPAATPADRRILDLYARVASLLPGGANPRVRAWRNAAIEAFSLVGLPHRRIEEWKYTDLRTLMPEVHPLAGLSPVAGANVSVEGAVGRSLAHLDAYRAIFVDGAFRPDLSTAQSAPGVTFQSLRAALEDEGACEGTVATLPPIEGDPITLLATAFATDGAMLSIASKARIDKPLHLIFFGGEAKPQLSARQNVIWVGEDADVTLIETHADGRDNQTFAFTRLGLGARARVRHICSTFGGDAHHLASLSATLGEAAHYEPVQMTVDGAVTRAQAKIRFEGEGARCHYAGAMLLRGSSHADFTLVVEHAAPSCESRELVKAVLDGRSRGVFQGKVVVERGAQKTDGKQMANALLLSDDAEFDSKPELEIYADDVACGHGATAGQLDEELMFYLRARGIPQAEARALLIAGFVGEALEKIEDDNLREALQGKVDAWLNS
jgi:Fe-S cluster assembly protein SufD